MPSALTAPISYLITDGRTVADTDASSAEFARLLSHLRAAVEARITLIQLREKSLRPRVLFELTTRAVELTRGTSTRLLVNDRADIALAAGADGVHLTTRSLDAAIIRRLAPTGFLIGVSTHTLAEARDARASGANFAVFGPVFDTPSKRMYGAPVGLDALREAAQSLAPFPVLALGGITPARIPQVIAAGAAGIAAIRLFGDRSKLGAVIHELRRTHGG